MEVEGKRAEETWRCRGSKGRGGGRRETLEFSLEEEGGEGIGGGSMA